MRVGRSTHPRARQAAIGRWTMPWQYRKKARDGDLLKYDNDPQWEPPEWFSLDDFDLPDGDVAGGWREIDSWAFGGLGLFERVTEELGRPPYDGHRTGLEFENELYDMTEAAMPMLTAFLDGVTWHTEFPYGWQAGQGEQGRTDIVICEFDWDAFWKRRRIVGPTSLSGQSWGYFRCYRWLHRRDPVHRNEFIDTGPYSDSYLREIWGWLERRGYLAYNGRGGYATAMPLPDHIKAAHAIELKQSTWEEALEQAQRANGPDDPDGLGPTDPGYARRKAPSDAGYADYRWVALDAGHLRAALEHRERFLEAGVGLLGVAQGGVVQLAPAEPCEHPPGSLDRMKLIEDSIGQVTTDRTAQKIKTEYREAVVDGADADATEASAQLKMDAFHAD